MKGDLIMLRRLQKMLCALLVALLLASSAMPALAASVTARVNSSSAKVYRKASKSSASVKLKKGTTVKVTAVSGSWAKVKKNGHTGYMPKKYLSLGSSASGGGSKPSSGKKVAGYVSKNTYVYRSASSSASRRSISRNTRVYVVGKSGSYYKVQNSSGSVTGYVKASCVSRKKAGGSSGGSSKKPSKSWKSRAVILKANGKYVASAINTKPHGDQTIHSNNYEGQFCLHTSGSMTHGSKKENSEHQKSINRAYKWAHR